LITGDNMAFLAPKMPPTITFTDTEFGALQCIFRLFKLLLQYHDPELSSFLDQYDTPPEVYASQWFVTIYAQKCPIETLLQIWDDLLLHPNQFHYFVSLELLRSQKAKILECRVDELPEVMSSISMPDKNQSRMLFLEAKKTYSVTPNSFHELLHKCVTQKVVVDGALYTELLDLQAMTIEPKELIGQLYSGSLEQKEGQRGSERQNSSKNSHIKYFVIDCRPLAQFEAGHLPCAFHLDPALNSESLQEKMENILTMKGSAFCLFFDGVPSKRTNINYSSHLYYFLNKRIKYISICRGGYYGVHQMLVSGELELVDHNSSHCLECGSDKKNQNNKGNFASYMKKFYNAAESLKRSNQSREETSIPAGLRVLPQTVDVCLTMTILRDKTTNNELYHKAVNRLLSVLVAEAIEKNNISQLQVNTNTSFAYNGFQTVRSIYGVALDDPSQESLEEALHLYHPVARTIVGQLHFEEKVTQDKNGGMRNVRSAVAYTPKDIEDRRVILFSPVLGSKKDLHSAVEVLYQLGTKDLTILTIAAPRSTLLALLDQFPNLQIICAAVDRFTNGQVVPGVGVFAHRYNLTKTSKVKLDLMTTVLGNVDPVPNRKNDCKENAGLKFEEVKSETKVELSSYSQNDTSVSVKFITKQGEDLGDLLIGATDV